MTNYPPIYRSKAGYDQVMAMYDEALNQGPVPYQVRIVKTRHGETNVVMGGTKNGIPIILFHGWNGNAAGTGAEFPFLFNAFRVYMPDIIGHAGRSAPNRPSPTGSTYADWAADVLDGLDIQQAPVIGISGGGWVSLKFAAYYPSRVTQVIAVSTDGLSPTNNFSMIKGMFPAALFPSPTTARWFLNFITAPNSAKDLQAQKFAEAMEIILKHYKAQNNPGEIPEEELRNITSPLLVLMGEYERIFRPHVTIERAENLIPGLVSAELVPQAGHLMTVDQPDWLKERVLKFIQAGI